jgi:hypothetical protein
LLLPALGVLSAGSVRLLCAVHTRAGDRLGYDWTDVSLGGQGPSVSHARLTALTAAPPGPGFFEIGEELALARTQRGLLTAVVLAGRGGAVLDTAEFSAPRVSTPPARAGKPAAAPKTHPGETPATAGHAAPASRSSGSIVMAASLGAAALCGAAGAGALVLRRRRSGPEPPARHDPPSHRRR